MYFGRFFNVANADITAFNTKTNKYEYWYLSVDVHLCIQSCYQHLSSNRKGNQS